MFKPYALKTDPGMAFQITSGMTIRKEAQGGTYGAYIPLLNFEISRTIYFKAYKVPQVGDWVVRHREGLTYHVTDAVFRSLYVVP